MVAWIVFGLSGLLVALLVWTAVVIPLRRLRNRVVPWGDFFSSLTLPVGMLIFSGLWLGLILAFPAAFDPFRPNRSLLEMWFLIWTILLLFYLSEGIGRIYTTYLRRELQSGQSVWLLLGRVGVTGASVMLVLQLAMELNASQLLTSTAVVATVLGFALREVLSNFLAGISINLSGTAQPAQWIAIGEKEGEIIQRNWRETRIRSTGGHIYIIPNSMVAHNLVNNMTWNSPFRRHQLDFPIDYAIAPAVVCQALLDAACSVPEVERSYKWPDAMVASCREQVMIYRVRFWSRTYHDRSRIEGLVQERVWYHLHRQGITMGGVVTVQSADWLPLAKAVPTIQPALANLDLLRESGFVQRYLSDEKGQLLLADSDLRHFADQLKLRRFGPGEALLALGEWSPICYILIRGEVIGQTELVSFQQEKGYFQVTIGDWVGEIALFSGMPRTATVTAGNRDAELLEVPMTACHFLLSCHEEIARIFYHRLAERCKGLLEECLVPGYSETVSVGS